MIVKVVNLVATDDLKQTVSLASVGNLVGGSYDPMKYHCAYFKRHAMFGKVTIFSSGKMISIGTRSPENAQKDLRFVVRELANAGLVRMVRLNPTVQNVVVQVDVEHTIDVLRLAQTLHGSMYEPEQFSGIIWRPKDFHGIFLIFSSGKVISSVKSVEDIERVESYLSKLA